MTATSLDLRVYRAGLAACPPAFRREYGAQMIEDFTEALDEASATGARSDRWWLRLQMGVDLARTLRVQWTRTGLPFIGIAAVLISLTLVQVLASFVVRRATFTVPTDLANADLIGLLILATVAVFIVASTICITLWANRPIRRPRRVRR
jgi:hypothetical protein